MLIDAQKCHGVPSFWQVLAGAQHRALPGFETRSLHGKNYQLVGVPRQCACDRFDTYAYYRPLSPRFERETSARQARNGRVPLVSQPDNHPKEGTGESS